MFRVRHGSLSTRRRNDIDISRSQEQRSSPAPEFLFPARVENAATAIADADLAARI